MRILRLKMSPVPGHVGYNFLMMVQLGSNPLSSSHTCIKLSPGTKEAYLNHHNKHRPGLSGIHISDSLFKLLLLQLHLLLSLDDPTFSESYHNGGPRLSTAMVWLQGAREGGRTVFAGAGVEVQVGRRSSRNRMSREKMGLL